MYIFKKLNWLKHCDGLNGLYAAPDGLKWRYSIIMHVNKIEFAILDHNYEYAAGFPRSCNSVSEAQKMALQHYTLLLQKHLMQ